MREVRVIAGECLERTFTLADLVTRPLNGAVGVYVVALFDGGCESDAPELEHVDRRLVGCRRGPPLIVAGTKGLAVDVAPVAFGVENVCGLLLGRPCCMFSKVILTRLRRSDLSDLSFMDAMASGMAYLQHDSCPGSSNNSGADLALFLV